MVTPIPRSSSVPDWYSGDNEWDDMINQISAETGMPAALLKSQMMRESSGNQSTVSDGGKSFGLMQMQEEDWNDFKKNHPDKIPDDLKNASWEDIKNNPRLNMEAAATMMKTYHDEFQAQGMSDEDAWKHALTRYNSGSPNGEENGDGTPGYADEVLHAADIQD